VRVHGSRALSAQTIFPTEGKLAVTQANDSPRTHFRAIIGKPIFDEGNAAREN